MSRVTSINELSINESCHSRVTSINVLSINESCHTYVCRLLATFTSGNTCWAVSCMGWLRLVGSLKLWVSFAEYSLFYRARLQKRPIILSILLTVATPYQWVVLRMIKSCNTLQHTATHWVPSIIHVCLSRVTIEWVVSHICTQKCCHLHFRKHMWDRVMYEWVVPCIHISWHDEMSRVTHMYIEILPPSLSRTAVESSDVWMSRAVYAYGVAMVIRIDKIIDLFCKRTL